VHLPEAAKTMFVLGLLIIAEERDIAHHFWAVEGRALGSVGRRCALGIRSCWPASHALALARRRAHISSFH
jgi:hypothetical protein